MTILIVDDSESHLQVLQSFLAHCGYQTVAAADGAEALAKARLNPPDLVVSDILMPVMDGFTLCREWKKDERLKGIPFVFYTSTYTDERDREFALGLGADRFLIKPEKTEVLIQAIREVLEQAWHPSAPPAPPAAGAPAGPPIAESEAEKVVYLKHYNEALIRKLESKSQQLERTNRELVQDIALRKQAEEELRASELRYRRLFETGKHGVLVLDAETGMVVDVNPFLAQLLGLSREALLEKRIWELGFFKAVVPNSARFAELQREESFRYDDRPLEAVGGRRIDVEFVGNVQQVDHRKVIQCNIRDITERKRTQEQARIHGEQLRALAARVVERTEELAKANEVLRAENTERRRIEGSLHASQRLIEGILNAMPARVFWKDKNLVYLGCNEAFARDAGFAAPKDIVGKDDYQMVWREQAESRRGDDRHVIESGCPKLLIEEPQKTSEGKIIALLSSKIPLRDLNGEVTGVLGMYMDIPERKKAEEMLRQRVKLQEQLAHTAASVPGMVYSLLMRPDGSARMPYASGALSKIFDLHPEDVVDDAAPLFSLIHPGDIGHVMATITESARTLNPWRADFRVCHTRLGEIWVEGHSVPRREPDGSTLWHGYVQDITGRKQAEEALQWKTALLEAQVNSSIDGIIVVDQQGKKVIQNQRVVDLFKIPRAIADGNDDAEQVKWVTDAVKSPGQFADKVAHLYSHPDEISRDEIELKDGTMLDRYSAPVVGKDGSCLGRIWTFRDITEHKRAEAALQQERNLLRTLIDHIPDYIYVRDLSNRFVVANASFARLMGVAGPSGLIGKRDADFYPPSTAADFDMIDQGVFAGCPHFNQERVLLFPNGQELATLNTKVPFKNDLGKVIGLIGVGRDITERKLAEAAMVEASGLIETLLQNTTDAIYFKDLQSRFVHFSAEMLRCFHLTRPEELKGRTDFDFFSNEHARPAFETEQEIIRTGKPVWNLEEKETHLDGRITWVSSSKMPWRDAAGKVIGTIGISRSITRQKEAQVELENLHKKLVDASREAGMAEVATNVLHNVGNVLNSVNISASLVAESAKKSRISSLARVVVLLQEHAHDLGAFITQDSRGRHVPAHLAQLSRHLQAEQEENVRELDALRRNVDHIKEIVAMQQNYATFAGIKEMVNVVDLVEDSLRINEAGLSRHDVEVIREFEDVPPLNVEKHQILQILVNLLRNAKYACDESKRADKRLTVRVANGEGQVRISVVDNGVGIPAENLTRIFNHGFTTRKGGHGFGLHSGALAAKEMGGSLTVHSDGPGQGAAFTLELPLSGPGKLP